MIVNEFQRAQSFNRAKAEERLLERLLFVTMDKAIESYILNCQVEERSKRTIESNRNNLYRFLWWLREGGYPVIIADISPDHIRRFLLYLKEPNRWNSNAISSRHQASATTVDKYYRTLKTFFNWARREKFVNENPLDNIKPPKLPINVIPIYSQEDIKALLAACPQTFLGIRNRAIILLALDTGLRLSELLGILSEDISIPGGLVKVRGKGSKERIVHFGKHVQQALLKYLIVRHQTDYPSLWLTEEGKPLTSRGFQIAFRRLAQSAGLKGKHTIHMLRHTSATLYLDSGDPLSLQYLLGHSSLSMVKRYTESKRAEQAIEQHRKNSPVEKLLE